MAADALPRILQSSRQFESQNKSGIHDIHDQKNYTHVALQVQAFR